MNHLIADRFSHSTTGKTQGDCHGSRPFYALRTHRAALLAWRTGANVANRQNLPVPVTRA
jgi:hypothetical protein